MKVAWIPAWVLGYCLLGATTWSLAAATDNSADDPPGRCAAEVWRAYSGDVWFYDAAGTPVVPQLDTTWLIVHFSDQVPLGATDDGLLPPAMARFNEIHRENIIRFIYDPTRDPRTGIYHVRDGAARELLNGVTSAPESESQVRYLYPALVVDGARKYFRDEVRVQWKTMADEAERRKLLDAIGGTLVPSAVDDGAERVTIDPCVTAVWQAANLLAEDIHVVSARPLLADIETPVAVALSVGMHGGTIGSAIPFSLKITFAERIALEPSTIANLNLRPRGLFRDLFTVEFDRPLSTVDLNQSPIHLTGHLYLYAPGDYALPEVPVYFRDSTAVEATLHVVKSQPVGLRIASMIPDVPGDYRLQVPDGTIPLQPLGAGSQVGASGPMATMALGLFGLLLAAGGYWALCRRGRQDGDPARGEEQPDNARARLIRFVEQGQAPMGTAELAAFGRALRDYLGEVCGLPKDALGGSLPVFFGALEPLLPAPARSPVYAWFELAETDLARGEVQPDTPARCCTLARQILLALERDLTADA